MQLPELKSLVNKFQPHSILALGPLAPDFFADYVEQHSEVNLDAIHCDQIAARMDTLGKYDLAFVSHCLEYMDKTQADIVISKLRDLHSERLIVVIPIGLGWSQHKSHWTHNEMLAFGLVHIGSHQHQNKPVHVYAFDLTTYKATPEWLNSRYWAHPEMFDKYW